MPTKAELVSEIYLLLAAIHLHGFVMSQEMAQKIFDCWPVVICDRPDSPKDIMDNFNAILQQRPARILAQDPAETIATQTSKHSQTQKIVKNSNLIESTPEPSRSHKPVKSSVKSSNTPSPFSLASHSRKPVFKIAPKATPTPRTTKKELTDESSLVIKPIFAVKRDFIDLTDDISGNDEDETPSKKPKMR